MICHAILSTIGFSDGIEVFTFFIVCNVAELGRGTGLNISGFATILRHGWRRCQHHTVNNVRNRLECKCKGFVGVIGRIRCITNNFLDHFRIGNNLLIMVGKQHRTRSVNRSIRFFFLDCLLDREALHYQILIAVVPADYNRHRLRIFGVIRQTVNRRLCIFCNGIRISTGHSVASQNKLALSVMLQSQCGRCNGRLAHNLCSVRIQRGNGFHCKGKITFIGVAFDDLLNGHVNIHLAVCQLGEENQRNAVFYHSLNVTRFANSPAGITDFDPAIGVHMTIFVHLVHASSHSRPVVSLTQGNGITCTANANTRYIFPYRLFIIRVNRTLQLHCDRQVVGYRNAAIHQPLLGDRQTVSVFCIGIDQRGRSQRSGGR